MHFPLLIAGAPPFDGADNETTTLDGTAAVPLVRATDRDPHGPRTARRVGPMSGQRPAPGPSRGGACGDTRVPPHPARPDHPGAGRSAHLRARTPPRHRATTRGGGAAGRGVAAVLRPARTRRRHRHLRAHHRRGRPRSPARRRRARPSGRPAQDGGRTPPSPSSYPHTSAADPACRPAPDGRHARRARVGPERPPGDPRRQRPGARTLLTRVRRPGRRPEQRPVRLPRP